MEDEDNIYPIKTGSHPNRNPQLNIRHFGYFVYIKHSEFGGLGSRMGKELFSSWFFLSELIFLQEAWALAHEIAFILKWKHLSFSNMPLMKKSYWKFGIVFIYWPFLRRRLSGGVGVCVVWRFPCLYNELDDQAIPQLWRVFCKSLLKPNTQGLYQDCPRWAHQEIILGPNWSPKETL